MKRSACLNALIVAGALAGGAARAGTANDVDQLSQYAAVLGAANACHLDTAAETDRVKRWVSFTFLGPGQFDLAMGLLSSETAFHEREQLAHSAASCRTIENALIALS